VGGGGGGGGDGGIFCCICEKWIFVDMNVQSLVCTLYMYEFV